MAELSVIIVMGCWFIIIVRTCIGVVLLVQAALAIFIFMQVSIVI